MTAVTRPEIVSFSSNAFCRLGPVFRPIDLDQRKLVITLLIAPLHADVDHVAGLDGNGPLSSRSAETRHDAFGLLADIEEHVLVIDGDNGGFAALLARALRAYGSVRTG